MYTPKALNVFPLVGLLALPVAANARTINLFEAEDGYQAVPKQASSMGAEKNPYAELATMTISDIIKMEVDGKPVVVQLHIPAEDGTGNGAEIVVYSTEYPEGVVRPGLADPTSVVPLPAAAWLMLSGLLGMAAVGRRRFQDEAVG